MTGAGPLVLIGVLKISDIDTLGLGGAFEGTEEALASADVEVAIGITVLGNG